MMRTKKIHGTQVFIHAVLLLVAGFMLFPFVWMLLSSLKTTAEITRIPPTFFPNDITNIENFKVVLQKYNFGTFFKNSIYYAVLKSAIVLYVSCIVGYVLAKFRFRGRQAVFLMILATMMVPWPATLIPNYQMMVWLNWLDKDISILYSGLTSAYGVFLMRQFSFSIPDSLLEAARLDGAGELRIFHRIALPLMTNGIGALAIMTFLWEWDNYLWPYLMLSSPEKYTLPIGLAMTQGQFVANYGPMFAGITISVLPVVAVYLLFQRSFIQGIALGGVKE